jgi:uncharacterized C2H2 Zn-finger protein
MAFKTDDSFAEHKKSTHNNTGTSKLICKCALCDTVFHHLPILKDHFLAEHWPVLSSKNAFTAYKCNACMPQKLFNSSITYSLHVLHCHGQKVINVMCNKCGIEMASTEILEDHYMNAHKEHNITVQKNTTKKIKTNTTYIVENTKKLTEDKALTASPLKPKPLFECKRCNTIIADESTYKKHMAKHRFVQKRKLLSEKVPALKIKKLRVENLSSNHTFKVVNNDISADGGSTVSKVFVSQVPTAPQPRARHKCTECEEKFLTSDEVQEHLRMSHGIQPQFPCHLCGNTYDSQELVERHVQLVHEGKSKDHPFLCWLCLENNNTIKGYSSAKMLEKHLTGQHKMHRNNIDYSRFPKFTKDGDSESVGSKRSDSDHLEDTPVKRYDLHRTNPYSV